MDHVNITELRAHLPSYLDRIQKGESLTVVSRGKPIARLIPVNSVNESAGERLAALRKHARIGDVEAPLDTPWNANRDPG